MLELLQVSVFQGGYPALRPTMVIILRSWTISKGVSQVFFGIIGAGVVSG